MSAKTLEVRVDKIVNGGAGLGRCDGKVIFIPFTAPGDRVRVRIVDEKRNFATGEVVQILEGGVGRVSPPCPHFARCGGCDWQHLDYPTQISLKQSLLAEAFTHHFPESRDLPFDVVPSPQPYGYRSRARIQVKRDRGRLRIGFFRYRSHLVEDVASCPLFRPSLNAALASLRAASGEITGDAEYDLACSEETGKWSLGGSTAEDARRIPRSLHGESSAEPLSRTIGEFSYRLTTSAFFQANDWLIENLVRTVDQLTSSPGVRESALELYAGVGLFTLPLARRFLRVSAVEASSEASALCRSNLAAAGMNNAQVRCADVVEWLRAAHPGGLPSLDLVLLDPPRSGAGRAVMEAIAAWGPQTVVYVSCDLQTLCRDASQLRDCGYLIDAVTGFDLFPQTHHFETVVRFHRTD